MAATRVLQVVLSLNPGGTERLVIDLATRLNAEMPTAICCLDAPGDWAADVTSRGIPVTALGRRPGFHPVLGRAVARVAARHGATVIHAHQYSPFVYSALARLWRPGLRVVFTEHGRLSDAGPSSKRKLANQVMSRLASRTFTVSEDVKSHLVAEGFRPDAVGVIYNGIDIGAMPTAETRTRVRRELGAADTTFVVGTIARLDPVKDIAALLGAAAQLSDSRPLMVVVIGDGPERPRLEELARKLGLSSRVKFLGHRSDARDWLAACDAYANSSVSEGVSLTILEAMAAGLPVAVTGVGGTPEVVDASCGRVVPARNQQALARALAELADDPGLRRALGAAGRARVEARFTLERMIREYASVYAGRTGTGNPA